MKNKLIKSFDNIVFSAESWGRDGLRIKIHCNNQKQTSDWALDIPVSQESQTIIEQKKDSSVIINGKIKLELTAIWGHPIMMNFYRKIGDEYVAILREKEYPVIAHWPDQYFKKSGDNLKEADLRFEANNDEHFYGMGANETGGVDLKGCVIDLYQRHIKSPVPFVVSSRKYGFLWNNPSLGRVEFAKNMTRWTSQGTRQIDFYITVGDTFADILENYTSVTGRAPEFPEWAGGFWQCKLRYHTQDEVLELAKEFKRRELPVSVIVIDYYHWKNFGDWKADKNCWPDLAGLAKTLKEMGIKLMISPWTLLAPEGENYEWMQKNNAFTFRPDMDNDDPIFFDKQILRQYDPTNPVAATRIKEAWKRNYVDNGIDIFWLDPCDDFHEIADYDKVFYHIGPGVESHSFYVTQHQKNIYEMLKESGVSEVCNIVRNAWAGSQRYGACLAPHDIESSWKHMEEYFKVGLNVMMSGIAWWNCDIGGFHTKDYLSEDFKERMIRYYQWGVFMPVFRTHGFRPHNEPWTFGDEVYPYLQEAIMLRERLRPYLMEQMRLTSERGIPAVRPLFFDFEDDEKCYSIENEAMFGADILFAPIFRYGARDREIYLPEGCNWIDAYTGKLLTGGREFTASAPLNHIPVYVRESAESLLKLFEK